MTSLVLGQRLDGKGRCCGRKPIHYKRPYPPHHNGPYLYCTRCSASFDPETGMQTNNWAYREVGTEGFFMPRYPNLRRSES